MPYLSRRTAKPRVRKRNGKDAAQRLSIRYRPYELKRVRTAFTADPSSAGAVVNLMPVAQGDNDSDRQGNSIVCRSMEVRGSVIGAATVTTLRMMIVRDNYGSTTNPLITALFSSVVFFAANRNRLGDVQSTGRFTILWDHFMRLTTADPISWFSFKKKLNSVMLFDGTASTDEGKGGIYLFIASNEATSDPIVTADCQIHYTDS